MEEGIGRTTFGRVSGSGARPSVHAREVEVEAASGDLAATIDAGVDGDIEARHRLRRVLRILVAARRRDDGASRYNGS